MDEELKKAAERFGSALANSEPLREYQAALAALDADGGASAQKDHLEEVYDDLVRRQSRGEIIAQGEIEAYYALEQQVRSNPQLARRDAAFERVKDYFSEAHNILSDHLGVTFVDLVKE
jgi:cell fate (sporulation/competence/biofilm development) regulator YlbF (YheA/YmcA/DUF963 family)